MDGKFFDDPRWRRRLKIFLFITISTLILAVGVAYQWFSDQHSAQTLVFKIFVVLFTIVAWASLLICIWMNRPFRAPLRGGTGIGQNSVHPDLLKGSRMKNEASDLIRRIDAIRLRMDDTVGECAEDSQEPPGVTSKEAA